MTNAVPPAETMPFGGRRAVVEGVRDLAGRGEAGVLAVVVATRGSAYRKPGASILLDVRGARAGALSGGCLEGELEDAARRVLESGIATDVTFDTSGDEDRVFGSGTGCGGSTRVYLLPLPPGSSPLREALLAADARGVVLDLVLADGLRLGEGTATVGADRFDFDARGDALQDRTVAGDAVHLVLRPVPCVLLLGAGPETRPLLRLTRSLGWRVELAEHRQRWARFAQGGGLDALHGEGPDGLAPLFERARFDAALVMNHNYLLDARCLARLAATSVPYVGLLGPEARRDDLMDEIGREAAERLRPRLHAPVGLRLGGEGAEAIALSIAAELQREFARRDGR